MKIENLNEETFELIVNNSDIFFICTWCGIITDNPDEENENNNSCPNCTNELYEYKKVIK